MQTMLELFFSVCLQLSTAGASGGKKTTDDELQAGRAGGEAPLGKKQMRSKTLNSFGNFTLELFYGGEPRP